MTGSSIAQADAQREQNGFVLSISISNKCRIHTFALPQGVESRVCSVLQFALTSHTTPRATRNPFGLTNLNNITFVKQIR